MQCGVRGGGPGLGTQVTARARWREERIRRGVRTRWKASMVTLGILLRSCDDVAVTMRYFVLCRFVWGESEGLRDARGR